MVLGLGSTGLAFSLTGSVSVDAGSLVGTGAWSEANGNVILSWEIFDPGSTDGLWLYQYTLEAVVDNPSTTQGGGISHVILEVSDTPDLEYIAEGAEVDEETGEIVPRNIDVDTNDQGDASIYGFKWETIGEVRYFSWEIQTNTGPMWGMFAAKDGVDTVAYNAALLTDIVRPTFDWDYYVDLAGPDANSFDMGLLSDTDWVLVPDTYDPYDPIPEPSTVFLLGIGLLGILGLGRKFKK